MADDREIRFECEDCGAVWSDFDRLPIAGHALAKEHRVYNVTRTLYIDGHKTGNQ